MALALAARVEAERSPGGQRFSRVLAANPIHLGMALATGAAPRVAAGASVQVGPSG